MGIHPGFAAEKLSPEQEQALRFSIREIKAKHASGELRAFSSPEEFQSLGIADLKQYSLRATEISAAIAGGTTLIYVAGPIVAGYGTLSGYLIMFNPISMMIVQKAESSVIALGAYHVLHKLAAYSTWSSWKVLWGLSASRSFASKYVFYPALYATAVSGATFLGLVAFDFFRSKGANASEFSDLYFRSKSGLDQLVNEDEEKLIQLAEWEPEFARNIIVFAKVISNPGEVAKEIRERQTASKIDADIPGYSGM